MDVLIPIAVSADTGEWMEVTSVPRGRACGCLCPSCEASVVAKHGEVNVWHFAHDKEPLHAAERECELSFNACCRVYLRQLFVTGYINCLLTPGLSISDIVYDNGFKKVEQVVSQERSVSGWRVKAEPLFDVELLVLDTRSIHIQFTYPGRPAKPVIKQGEDGYLIIDLDRFREGFGETSNKKLPLKDYLKGAIEGSTLGKTWDYHPRLSIAKQTLANRVEAIQAQTKQPVSRSTIHTKDDWPLESESSTKSHSVPKFGNYDDALPPPSPEALAKLFGDQSSERKMGRYTCLSCGNKWCGPHGAGSRCGQCGEYLYSRFEELGRGDA